MVSNHVFYQLVLLGLLWLCIMVVLCAFEVSENGRTLIVMMRVCTRYIGDLGKSRQATMQKAWHVHENTMYRDGTF